MRTKFLALLLCVAVLNLTQLSTAIEAKDDGGYNVVYDGGSIPGLKAGVKLRVYIETNQIRIMENNTLVAPMAYAIVICFASCIGSSRVLELSTNRKSAPFPAR